MQTCLLLSVRPLRSLRSSPSQAGCGVEPYQAMMVGSSRYLSPVYAFTRLTITSKCFLTCI
jgi:hypothetical protein